MTETKPSHNFIVLCPADHEVEVAATSRSVENVCFDEVFGTANIP